MSYDVSNTAEGVFVSIGGYNDKLAVLLKVVLEKLKGLVVTSDRFEVMKEQVGTSLHSSSETNLAECSCMHS